MISKFNIETGSQGLFAITEHIQALISEVNWQQGLCSLFIPHTSASLLIQENYDPSAQADLQAWLNRLVPEGDSLYTHTLEGADDMPAHIKSTLTATSIAIPVSNNRLMLGTWQGIYLWEHRLNVASRQVIAHLAP